MSRWMSGSRGLKMLGFPPRSTFILLPSRPSRAITSGLALYTAVRPHQRLAVASMRAAARLGLAGALRPLDRLPPEVAWAWEWVDAVATAHLARPAALAVRLPGDGRLAVMLLDVAGRPTAFARFRPSDQVRPDEHEAAIAVHLQADPPRTFGTPAMLTQGSHRGCHFRVFEPLPEGPHRPVPHDPVRLATVVDELQQRLAWLPRTQPVPDRHRPQHGDLSPRNLRLASDGRWWIYDWEYAGWAPRLVDEVRYLCAESSHRPAPRRRGAARQVLQALESRGDRQEIVEALRWPYFKQASEQVVHDEVSRLAGIDD